MHQFQNALGLASKLVVVRSSLPILSHCLLGNGQLTVTDLDNYLTFDLPGLDIEPVCLPVALLQKALRFIKDPTRLVKQGVNVILNDTFTLPGMNPQEFPASPARAVQQQIGETFRVPERGVDVLPAMSTDETRLNLSGVYIDRAAGYCVSSGGHRLHALKVPAGAVASSGSVALPAASTCSYTAQVHTPEQDQYEQRYQPREEIDQPGAVRLSRERNALGFKFRHQIGIINPVRGEALGNGWCRFTRLR